MRIERVFPGRSHRKKALQLKIWKNIEERTQWAEEIHEKGSSNRECNFLKKNGEEWIRIMLSQLSILNEEKVVFNSVIDITEQRRVEKNLSQTQKQIQDIIDGTPNIVFVKDLEGRFVTVNRQFEQMLGTTSDQLRGKTDYDIFSKERAGYYREHDREAINGPIQIEEKTILADGKEHVFLANKYPLFDDQGRVYATCGVSADITERKRIEEALRASDEKFSKIFKNSPSCIVFTKYDGVGFVDVNDMWLQTYGIRREEALGKTALGLGLWVDLEEREECFARLRKDGRFTDFETVFNTHRGPRTFILGGEIIELMGEKFILWVSHDIDDRKKAEKELLRSREDLAIAQSISQVGSWRAEIGDKDIRWSGSEELHKIYGYSLDTDLTMQTWTDRTHPDDLEKTMELWTSALRGDGPGDWEHRIIVNDQEKWLKVEVQFRRSADGIPFETWGTCQDITEFKRKERNVRLAERVLSILNESDVLQDSITSILSEIKETMHVDAIGIRLRSNDDFPFFIQSGFSDDFLLAENTLVIRKPDGGSCSNPDDSFRLECTCGLVISGQTDPSNPLFTRGGSAWTNDSTELLNLSPEDDPRTRPRNRCVHDGYLPVALVPIRIKGENVGILQLNGRRGNCFTLDTIEALEGIAANIGTALMRHETRSKLAQSEARLDLALRSANMGVWFWDMIRNVRTFDTQTCFLLGIDPATFRGSEEEFLKIVHPDDRKIIKAAHRKTLEHDSLYDVDYRVIWPDGSIHHIRARGRLDRSDAGQPTKLNGVIWDITERKKAEERPMGSPLKGDRIDDFKCTVEHMER